MLNSENVTSTRTATWSEVPQLKSHDAYHVIDAWTSKDLGCVKTEYSTSLESHDVAVLVVKRRCQTEIIKEQWLCSEWSVFSIAVIAVDKHEF